MTKVKKNSLVVPTLNLLPVTRFLVLFQFPVISFGDRLQSCVKKLFGIDGKAKSEKVFEDYTNQKYSLFSVCWSANAACSLGTEAAGLIYNIYNRLFKVKQVI